MLDKVDPLLMERLGMLFSLRPREECDHVLICRCARCVAWDKFAYHDESRDQVATWMEEREEALNQFQEDD